MGKWPSLDKIELKNGSIGDKEYVRELRKLQHQLLDLQIHHHQTGGRVVIGIDGWDAAGKGGVIKRITQRLILQPRAELNFAAQDVPENRIGSGLSNAELGLRLRYEIRREFAPYVGVSWDRRFGDTARYARADGDRATSKSIVAGVRVWF